MKKFIAIATALTVVGMVAGPGPASAITADELQVQITALLAQLSLLQSQLAGLTGTPTTGIPAACAGITFSRSLAQGSSGTDVKCLQAVMNTSADTRVAASGVGSMGSETTYFGSLTFAAVVKFQNKYASEILTPIGLSVGTGFVGPATRAKLNAMLSSGTVTPTPTIVPTGAGLTVTLASNTPVAGTIVDGQGMAPLARFTFTNGDNAEVKVTTLKLKRIGVSADASLTNVYLFDGAARLTDSASVSSGVITFNDSNGLFKVGSGGSKTILVASDIDGTSGETMGVAVNAAADVTTNASAVNGVYPINSNLQTLATATLAGVSFNTTTTPSSDADITPQNDFTVWQNITTITTRAVTFNRISLREIGTIDYAGLQNFRLFVDGVAVGTTVQNLDSNGYITFDLLASPRRLEAGARTIKVLADIIGGSSRTFKFSLRVSADANFVDTQYGVNVLPQANSTTFTARTTGIQTVSTGTLIITKTTDSPAANIIDGSSNATLAKFTLTAAGEKVKIETLYVEAIWTNSDSGAGEAVATLRNGMLIANGVQVGSTASLDVDDTTEDDSGTTFNLGSSLVVEPGNPVTLEIRADIFDNDGTNHIEASDTLKAEIIGSTGNDNATGQVSLATIDVPSSDAAGNTLTVKQGALTLAKYTAYTNLTMVPPLTKAKLGFFTLTADTTEAVNLNTLTVDFDNPTDAADGSSDLANLFLAYGTTTSTCDTATTTVKATVADSANAWSVNTQLAAGQTVNVLVCSDVLSTITDGDGTADEMASSLTVTGITASSATSVTGAEVQGQTMTFGTGSITSALDAGTPADRAVAGNQTVTAGKFKFTAANETFTIKELKVLVGSTAASAVIQNAILKDGATVLGTTPFNTTGSVANDTAYFTGLNVEVPTNTSKVLTVDLALSTPSSDLSTDQLDVLVTLDSFKPYDSQGVEYTTLVGTNRAANNLYVYKSVPTFTHVPLTDAATQGINLTASSTVTLYKFKVAAASQGEVDLKQLKFTVAITDSSEGGAETLNTFKFFRNGTDITTSDVAIQDPSGTSIEGTTSSFIEGTNTVIVTFTTEEAIAAGVQNEYMLKATPGVFVSNTAGSDSVSTLLAGDAAVSSASSLYYVFDSGTGTVQQLATAADGTGATAENVIWSDNSAVGHSYTSTESTADWVNSVATLLNLPLDGQGIAAQ